MSQLTKLSSHTSKDRNSCVVHALANSAGITFELAYELCSGAGRQKNKGMHWSVCAPIIKTVEPYSRQMTDKELENKWGIRMSLGYFAKEFKTSSYFVTIAGHAVAVVDGMVVDNMPRPKVKAKIMKAWKLYD